MTRPLQGDMKTVVTWARLVWRANEGFPRGNARASGARRSRSTGQKKKGRAIAHLNTMLTNDPE
jgi:hypothetical protein